MGVVMLKSLALKVPQIKQLWDDRTDLLAERDMLLNKIAAGVVGKNPFLNYESTFDAIEVMKRHARNDLSPLPGRQTNFLGVKIDPRFFPGILDNAAGTVEGIPIPANWHADIAEWAAALRAVDLARDTFRVIELGCGWGCWLINTGTAARSAGLSVEMIGVEGDQGHVEFAHQAMEDNDFSDKEYRVIHGIAAAQNGKALFPVVENSGATWGSEPVLDASAAQIAEAEKTGGYAVLDTFPISEIADGRPVDLLHIDIQGGEADFVKSSMDDLLKYVRYVVIGTHSRAIEGRLMESMLSAGWYLEMERAAIIGIADGRPAVTVDGVQGWRNPQL